jgi:very-short-patch-repair endonuclease
MTTEYPGKSEGAPSWYKDRGPSYIEKKFSKELDDLAELIEKEVWFGDASKHARYRVDFILKDARLIVELDGHEYHSTKEQLEKDATRQRYLTRAGYSVIRFTGGQINKDSAACVAEVRQIYRERMQRAPSKYRALYIDYQFFIRQSSKAAHFYKNEHPGKPLISPSLEQFIPHAIEWLHEKSFVTAFVFLPPEEMPEIEHLDGTIAEYDKGEVRINVLPDEWYTVLLGEHMVGYSYFFDEFFLVADDPVYVQPLRSVLPAEFGVERIGAHSFKSLAGAKILRKCNAETAFVGTDLAHVRWQDVWYPIGTSMGLDPHEL